MRRQQQILSRYSFGGGGLGSLGTACLSPVDAYSVATAAGFPAADAVTATAIAMAESGGCPDAYNGGNPPGAESSYGLWQINIKGNPRFQSWALTDPATNGEAAVILFRAAGWRPWSVYNSGAYLQYMSAAQAAQLNQNQAITFLDSIPDWTGQTIADLGIPQSQAPITLGIAGVVLIALGLSI